MTTPIQLCSPNISGNEWQYVKECLDTGWVSSVGSYVDKFESAVAAQSQMKFAVATTSGTAALHIALILAGVQPDDEVLTSSLTFIAPANVIRYVGAHPVFVDADPAYWQFDVAKAERFLREDCERRGAEVVNRKTRRVVRAILPIDALGHPAPMKAILALAEEFGLKVVQDSTESLGAYCDGAPVGSVAPIACFSFNGNKLLTTGGGGMLVTNLEDWARRARHLTTQAKSEVEEYIHDEVGYNYRLTNVQAAIGCAQMEQLPAFVDSKRRIATRYAEFLSAFPGIQPMQEAPWARSTFWMFTALFPEPRSSRDLMRALAREKIQSRPLWQPLHLSPAHAGSQTAGGCPVAERLYREGLSLPCSTWLDETSQERVCAALRLLLA